MTNDTHILAWLEDAVTADNYVRVARTARGYEVAVLALGRYVAGRTFCSNSLREAFAQAIDADNVGESHD